MFPDAATWMTGVMPPCLIALSLAALTLLLEDAAIAVGILLVGEGVIGLPLAFAAVAGGIAGGDLLLYLLGAAARRVPVLHRRVIEASAVQRAHRLLDRHMAGAVFVARIVPGLRLALYTAAGFFALPFVPFALLVAVAVGLWTGMLFWLGSNAGTALAQHWGAPAWPAAIALFLLLALVPPLARHLAAATRWRCS